MQRALEVYSANLYVYNGTQRIVSHTHEEAYQLYYVLEGTGRYLFGDKPVLLREGQYLLAKPGEAHGMFHSDCRQLLDIKFGIFDPALAQEVQNLAPIQQVPEEVDSLFRLILRTARQKCSHYNKLIALQLETILYLLLQQPKEPEDLPPVDYAALSPCVQRMLSCVEGSVVLPVQPFSLDAIAAQAGYNKRYICSRFSEEIGMSVTRYFRLLRISRAKALLRETDLKISAIARLLGYEDVSRFIRNFRQTVGTNPNTYRKQTRE